jgi:type IV pilus assembly protein PilA
MLCPRCGRDIPENALFCGGCGQSVNAGGASGGDPGTGGQPATSGKAIASLVLGFFSAFPPIAILAVIFGHLSLSEIKRSAGRLTGKGMAITGLVFGYLGLAFIPILIIAAIAIPNLLRARLAANEASAASSVREVNMAEVRYASQHPDTGFTCNLGDLELPGSLASGARNGYVFSLRNCTAQTEGAPNTKFQVIAYPQRKNTTGTRVFCSDESLSIRFDASGSGDDCLEVGSKID